MSTQGGRGERVAVYLDGKRAFEIASSVATKAELRKDEWLSEERLSELLREDEPHRAREIALGMLARRDHLGAELLSKLLGRGVSEEMAEATVEWLEDQGYVDDRRYAAKYVADRTKVGWGRRRVVAELAKRGLERQIAEEAWRAWAEEHAGEGRVEELADLVARRFSGQLLRDSEAATKRASGFLARRGHDWETISAVLAAVRSRGETVES